MSILKHIILSILITIFVAWCFHELNLQMVYPNAFPALIFGCIVWTQVLLWTYVFSTSFKNWYQNFIHEKTRATIRISIKPIHGSFIPVLYNWYQLAFLT